MGDYILDKHIADVGALFARKKDNALEFIGAGYYSERPAALCRQPCDDVDILIYKERERVALIYDICVDERLYLVGIVPLDKLCLYTRKLLYGLVVYALAVKLLHKRVK